jgi:hypothetical protein
MDENPYESPQAELVDPPPPGSDARPDFLSQLIGTLTLLALLAVFLACAGAILQVFVFFP